MNAQNAAQYLPLVQALADGKTIQFNYPQDNKEWNDIPNPSFSYPPECWRIKTEPREWTVRRNTFSGMITATGGPELGASEIIRVREILD